MGFCSVWHLKPIHAPVKKKKNQAMEQGMKEIGGGLAASQTQRGK
jgi:hypothetical protein